MQSIINGQSVSTPNEIHGSTNLKSGQILFGKVNKLFPNQTAEVQIGQQKMIAHLDVPLQVGERYWLQVQPIEGQVVLKVLDSPNVNLPNIKEAAAQLLVNLGVKSEPESAKLAEFLLRNQFPITKDIFSSALRWVKAASTTESGLSVIKTMFTQQVPFVKDVFFALAELAKNEPFHKLLSGLQQQLQENGSETKTVVQLNAVLESLHITKQEQLQQTGLHRLIATWLDSKSTPDMKSGAFSLLQKTGFIPSGISETELLRRIVAESVRTPETMKTPTANKLQQGLQALAHETLGQQGNMESNPIKRLDSIGAMASSDVKDVIPYKSIATDERSGLNLNLLERAFGKGSLAREPGTIPIIQRNGILSGNEGPELISESLKSPKVDTQLNGMPKMVQQSPVFTEEVLNLTSRLLERAFSGVSANSKITPVDQEVDELLIQINKDVGQIGESKGKVGDLLLQAFKQVPEATSAATNPEKLALTHLIDEGFQPNDFTNGTAVALQLKKWTKILGLQLEHVLANLSGGESEALAEELETLKPLLLKLLNEQHPPALKDMAEQIVNRLTAQQILSQDNGPMQNLLLTLPLNLGSSQTDLTLQWSGRKTKDGKIDPAYCRILFYLELENLNETIIDMHIQNRVINVTIINEQNQTIETVASNYLDVLKDNLRLMDYKLSGVIFRNTAPTRNAGVKQTTVPFSESGTYSGVDIRI